jgi:hypothetical protein
MADGSRRTARASATPDDSELRGQIPECRSPESGTLTAAGKADDSAGYLNACRRSQEWYDTHVGLAEGQGIKLQASSLRLEAYPNPASNLVRIRLSSPPPAHSSLSLYNSAGRLVLSSPVSTSSFALRTSSLPSGIYLIRLTAGDKTLTQRVAIVR